MRSTPARLARSFRTTHTVAVSFSTALPPAFSPPTSAPVRCSTVDGDLSPLQAEAASAATSNLPSPSPRATALVPTALLALIAPLHSSRPDSRRRRRICTKGKPAAATIHVTLMSKIFDHRERRPDRQRSRDAVPAQRVCQATSAVNERISLVKHQRALERPRNDRPSPSC
jgi:hypothetical protein